MATLALNSDSDPDDKKKVPEHIQTALKKIIELLEKEDQPIREIQLRLLKKMSYFWKGIQYIFWSDLARDWQNFNIGSDSDLNDANDVDPAIFAKVVNIYRAHGESIISALSAGTPHVHFPPDDADNPEDVDTAKAFAKIARLIEKHNNAEMLMMKALYYIYNSYFAAFYNQHYTSHDFGTIKKPIYGEELHHFIVSSCGNCGEPIDEEDAGTEEPNLQEKEPQLKDCFNCESQNVPVLSTTSSKVPMQQGVAEIPKGREIIEVYGTMHVKVPSYVAKLADAPYLGLDVEHHYSLMLQKYPHLKGKLSVASGDFESYDKWARSPTEYAGDSISKRVTWRRVWLRPSSFNILDEDEELVEELNEMFETGVRVELVNSHFGDAVEEDLDDHWTLTEDPLSEHIHATARGEHVLQLQEMRNELTNLMMQSIQYGIPETYVDSAILDFDKFRRVQAKVGSIYSAKAKPGQKLQDSFYTIQLAKYPEEAQEFLSQIDKDAQFVSGSFPPLYGGQQSGGSKTLGEYEMSRNQSLQRLSTSWKVLNYTWAKTMKKSARSYADNMEADEFIVQKSGAGYINSWIRLNEVKGKIGDVEPETSEEIPVSWDQKRALVMNMLQMGSNNPLIGLLMNPSNASFIARLISLDDVDIPGDEDHELQLQEIADMLQGIPVDTPMQIVDHQVHAAVCKKFLVSIEGQDAKKNNPQGYQMILEHLMLHLQAVQPQPAPQGPRPNAQPS